MNSPKFSFQTTKDVNAIFGSLDANNNIISPNDRYPETFMFSSISSPIYQKRFDELQESNDITVSDNFPKLPHPIPGTAFKIWGYIDNERIERLQSLMNDVYRFVEENYTIDVEFKTNLTTLLTNIEDHIDENLALVKDGINDIIHTLNDVYEKINNIEIPQTIDVISIRRNISSLLKIITSITTRIDVEYGYKKHDDGSYLKDNVIANRHLKKGAIDVGNLAFVAPVYNSTTNNFESIYEGDLKSIETKPLQEYKDDVTLSKNVAISLDDIININPKDDIKIFYPNVEYKKFSNINKKFSGKLKLNSDVIINTQEIEGSLPEYIDGCGFNITNNIDLNIVNTDLIHINDCNFTSNTNNLTLDTHKIHLNNVNVSSNLIVKSSVKTYINNMDVGNLTLNLNNSTEKPTIHYIKNIVCDTFTLEIATNTNLILIDLENVLYKTLRIIHNEFNGNDLTNSKLMSDFNSYIGKTNNTNIKISTKNLKKYN